MRSVTILSVPCRHLDPHGRIEDTRRPQRQPGLPVAARRLAVASLLLAALAIQAQPLFISEPQGQSVSLGVEIILYAEAYGPTPVTYQWRKNGVELPGETIEILYLDTVQLSDAGDYDVVASDFSGSVTSQVATITVDPSFTKITRDPVVNGLGAAVAGCWGDYDNDGNLDLFVSQVGLANGLFRNNGNGTFSQITTGAIASVGVSRGAVWSDANNDGFLDLFVANDSGQSEFFFLNNRDGSFTRITNSPVANDAGSTVSLTTADFDNDGWLDVFTLNFLNFSSNPYDPPFPGTNYLYRNQGGVFTRATNAPGNETGSFYDSLVTSVSWADYNDDRQPDLFLARGVYLAQNNALYRNQGSNLFARVWDAPIASDPGNWTGGAWGDYDNDGFLDLFAANGFQTSSGQLNALYHNAGNGTFTKVTNGPLAAFASRAGGAAWADYDNDGWLDLFVSELGPNTGEGGNNYLWHNDGDGRFTEITTGSLVHDGGTSYGCAWGDYDNDGFLDLFVANGDGGNFLYRSSGNSNAWLKVQCVGRLSNRLGIGAKVRVGAVIGGTYRWQLREISGGYTLGSQSLLASFGLGDATQIDALRLEWPSGVVQELTNLPVRQMLTLTESTCSLLPLNPGAALGADFTFSVVGVNGADLLFQWRFNGVDIPEATNAVLVVTNVQTTNLGSYTLVIRDAAGVSSITAPALLRSAVRPTITTQPSPLSQSASLGVNLTYSAAASGTGPLFHQWRQNGVDLPDATNTTLSITNLQPAHAGSYALVVTNWGGAVTSRVVTLNVDPTFTKVTLGNVVNDGGASYGAAWLELDTGPYPALFVANALGQDEFLYRNNHDGSFTRLLTADAGMIVSEGGESIGVAVGDYDNDGHPDVFVANGNNQNNALHRNNGDGTFTKISDGSLVNDGGNSYGAAWGDYDKDGFLDLYVANSGNDFLYHNNGDGSFTRITNTVIATDGGTSRGCTWADYDNDGDLDLFVANFSQNNFLYRNNDDGSFTKVTTGNIVSDGTSSSGCAWGDYDNDGDLDLFVARNGYDFFYRNNGDGTFTRITGVPPANDAGSSLACAWADYDNDGWLDLYVANSANDSLFHNNGDGSFTRITAGNLGSDGGDSRGCAWGDYDNDGFPDLFVSNYGTNNFLYHTTANSNRWLKVKCVGTASNRSAIGAKVRVQTVVNGTNRWQLREITSGDGLGSQGLIAMFGLGQATTVATLRIEWPSGSVQELHDLAPNQFLTIAEPPRLGAPQMVNGLFRLDLTGGAGLAYAMETSTNLVDWSLWQTVTNLQRTITLHCPPTPNADCLYYRARAQ